MFDFGSKWTPAAFDKTLVWEAEDLSVRLCHGLHLNLVSGNTAAGLAKFGHDSPPIGVTAVAASGAYALAMARDRCLAVSEAPFPAAEGWFEEGYAITAMTDAYAALEFRGTGVLRILARATTLDWSQPARSAAISFAGVAAAASFCGDRQAFRMFVETPLLPYVLQWLDAARAG